ncbi:MAG: FtsX-like permease family protein [Verrucomicrobia bacterium]|nr:FtsX-like permease family protein [Verrucomicrobiota bacterium]
MNRDTASGSLPSGVLPMLWRRFSVRHALQSPLQSVLLVVILSLGVGVFFAVRLANRAAVASFQNFTDLITAESDGLIAAPSGTLPETVLTELREALADEAIQIIPVVETTATLPRVSDDEAIGSRSTFQVLGLDLIAVQNLADRRPANRQWLANPGAPSGGEPDASDLRVQARRLWESFRDPHSVFVSPRLAIRRHLVPGQEFPLVLNEAIVPLRVAGIIPTDPGQPEAPAELLVMDLPAAQQWSGWTGRLSRIEFVLEEGPDREGRWRRIRETLERLALRGPGGMAAADGTSLAPRWLVGSPADRRQSGEVMTRAFRLNLTILSMLALVVGVYLVFQALDGAVVRRREEIAILRSLGIPPGLIQRAWLGEAALLGLLGGSVGLMLGWIGAQGAVRLVGKTVNALYYATSAEQASLHPGEALLALALAVLTSLIAGWLPARAAAETPPAQSLGRGHGTTFTGPLWLQRTGWAWILVVLGVALLGVPPWRPEAGFRVPIAAYGTAICWTLAAGVLGGAFLQGLAKVLAWPALRVSHQPVIRLALSVLREPTGRHRLAVAGLVCAVAMTGGMAILVGSFDTTMRGWIERTFQADLFLSSDGAQSASTENRISPETWRGIASHPTVERAQVIQASRLQLPEGETMLVSSDLAFFRDHAKPAWRQAPQDDRVFDPRRNGSMALVSEAFSERFQKVQGDRIRVPTPVGMQDLEIAGVFSDYGNERGSILVDRPQFVRWFGHELASSLILVLRPGSDIEGVRAEFRSRHPGLAVFTQSYLRAEALRIFRQTFAITYALELIGVTVAVAGLAFTLISVLWERRGDLTTLRALGLTRFELAAAAAIEGVVTALSGVLTGIVASLGLGWVLIHRVNQQTFGWTLETDWSWDRLVLLGLMVIGAAALAAWGAGRWGSRLPAEREE